MLHHIAYTFLSLATSAIAATICGTKGTDSTNISFYMSSAVYKGPTAFALCASYCKNDPGRCKSFRYSYWSDAAAQYCEFYESGL
jgi:hypothetical protein